MNTALISFLFFATLCCVHSQVFTIDLALPTTPFPHYWEECVGSGHALLGLRADWQAHLLQANQELGFKQVRFHGIFDDDLSVVLPGPSGTFTYSWYNIDTVYDFLVSLGMHPYVELSFMPQLLALDVDATVFHYRGITSPPKNYSEWTTFLQAFASHIIDRYGLAEVSQWSFEVWNEPNCGFFDGNQTEYFTLFQQTFAALKGVNKALRVGGPATCQSAWLPEFIAFAAANQIQYDFISTHEYPTDINPSNRDILYEVFSKSRSIVGPTTTLYYSEYNDGLYSNPAYHDTPYASSFILHSVHLVQGLVDVLSWWTFTDIFEGTAQIPVNTASNSSVGVWAILSEDSTTLDIIAYNFDLPDSNIQNETVTIQLNNLKYLPAYLTNAPAEWLAQGSPAYPNSDQLGAQLQASQLVSEILAPEKLSQTAVQFSIELPKWGSAHLQVQVA